MGGQELPVTPHIAQQNELLLAGGTTGNAKQTTRQSMSQPHGAVSNTTTTLLWLAAQATLYTLTEM